MPKSRYWWCTRPDPGCLTQRIAGGDHEQDKKILAPTDYSDLSCIGLRRAFETAHESGAQLTVLHVIDMSNDWFGKHINPGSLRTLMAEQTEFLDKFLRDKFGALTICWRSGRRSKWAPPM